MRRSWTPSIVPNGHDQNFHIVVNNYGKLGPAFAETDLEATITDLMSGQYSDPVREVPSDLTQSADIRTERRKAFGLPRA
jgi:hypothetical protein